MNQNQTSQSLAALQAEMEELQERVAALSDFVENGTVALHWVDNKGIIIWANQAELDLLGYKKEEYFGFPITDFHQDPGVIQEILRRLSNNEVLNEYPARLKCKDGSIKHVAISSNALFKNGKFIHSRCFTMDITGLIKEQHRKNRLLFLLGESEERLRLAIEATNLGTWDWDFNEGKIYLSDETQKILNLDVESLNKELILDIIHPDDRREVNLKIEKLKDDVNERHFDFTCRIIRPRQKTIAWVKVQGSTYFNTAMKLERVIGSILDITELKHSESKNAELVAIVNSSNDAIVGISLDGIITSWNHAAEELFGYSAEEMLGQSSTKLIPEDRKDEVPYILTTLGSGGSLKHFETQRLTKSGKIIDVSLTISPTRNEKGTIIGISKIARDITEKMLEQTRKNDFISMVSHELKTPLTSILLFTQMLQRRFDNHVDDFGLQMTTKIENQASKMNSMIRDFLSLARIEEGKLQIQNEPISILALFEEIKTEAEILITKHIIQVECSSNTTIIADRDKIGQVFMNLVSNAIKYSPAGSTITLGCTELNGKMKLYVRDEGIGIDLVDQKKLTNRFYRVDSEETNNISGFGIGLYIVSEILRYHHSKIEIESQKGVGTTFYFLLDKIAE